MRGLTLALCHGKGVFARTANTEADKMHPGDPADSHRQLNPRGLDGINHTDIVLADILQRGANGRRFLFRDGKLGRLRHDRQRPEDTAEEKFDAIR